ncbi:hypothetical protein [Pantoea vagans]|uniref:hypothetical protein n=1 Tax=Pantoea vagans TaxID=470934 RepID=UPI0023B16CD0|nr:hypothetical protein [Pantoea vagans]MDE8559338.1 hypothetical protein [Pantoea vagans]MDE8579338.1 hypothetical protein [Pantoea vagans]
MTHDEQVVLSLDGMVVFDGQGNTITALQPLTTRSEKVAQKRRALFRVIAGAEQD